MKIYEEDLIIDQAPPNGISVMPLQVEEKIKLLLTLDAPSTARTQCAQFLMVKLLDRPVLYDFEVATSIQYLCMKFPTEGEIAIVRGRQDES